MIEAQPQRGGDAGARLFFAFWPDAAARARIAAAAAAIAGAADARAVRAENYHLTIAFVGAVPAAALDRLQRIGSAQRAAPCAIEFDAYEYWPKPEVVVAAAHTIPSALADLWQALHRDLAEGGFALRPKGLRPHITLARKVAQAPVLTAMSPFIWRPREFCLVRSDTGGTESVYTVESTWPVLDETPSS